jgi:uncharacterized protein YuzE
MGLKPQFRHDPDANALYIRFIEAPVARTIEVEELIYLDIDEQGATIGIEFADADDVLPFIQRHHGNVEIWEELVQARPQTPAKSRQTTTPHECVRSRSTRPAG